METLFWLVVVAAVTAGLMTFWWWKEAVEHHYWDRRRVAITAESRESHARQMEMARAAMGVNSEMARAVRPPTLPGDEWKAGSDDEPEGGD